MDKDELKTGLVYFAQVFSQIVNAIPKPQKLPDKLKIPVDISMESNTDEQWEDNCASDGESSNDGSDNRPTDVNSKICNGEEIICNKCIQCVYNYLTNYNVHTSSCSTLHISYECLLTLSCTQMTCERCFSKLKLIKNRLCSLLGQEKLEAFLFIAIEKDILYKVRDEDIIEKLIKMLTVYRKLLVP